MDSVLNERCFLSGIAFYKHPQFLYIGQSRGRRIMCLKAIEGCETTETKALDIGGIYFQNGNLLDKRV